MASASTAHSVPLSNKRKRGAAEQDGGRQIKQQNMNGNGGMDDMSAFTPDVQQLLQGLNEHGISTQQENSTRTAQAALATPMQSSTYPEPGSYDGTPSMSQAYEDGTAVGPNTAGSTARAIFDAQHGTQNSNKPQVGSPQWHQQRKDNHKEVERRRREVINEGIENIAKIVPNVEKNKGAILSRTCQYIGELQGKERSFQTERATFEVALKELTGRLDRLKDSAQQAWAESAKWQQRCRDAGLHFNDYDDGALPSLGDGTDE